MLLTIAALLAILAIGFIAQRLGICLVKATREALQGSPWFLLAILVSGLWVWAYSILANLNAWHLPLSRFDFHPIFAIGGFIFGIGSSINQGCSVSTMNHFTRGNMSMLFTMLGWFLGWCIWAALSMHDVFSISYPRQAKLSLETTIAIAGPMALVTAAIILFVPAQRQRWLGISIIGCLAGILYYVEPAWAPSALIQDSVASALHDSAMPSALRYGLVAAMFLGMFASVITSKQFRLRWPTWVKLLRHLSAGTLMGLGASMALGGNDAQILMGLPAASLGGATALIAMIIGIAVEQILFQRSLNHSRPH